MKVFIVCTTSGTMSTCRVSTRELYRFMVDCLKAAGANPKASSEQADVLFQADRLGHPSHGLNRLEMHVREILSGACDPNNDPFVVKETASTALVEANNVLGATAGHFGMDIAICKAKTTGIGWVNVGGSTNYGMAGWWALKAAEQGMIGISFSNTPPLMAPTRSKQGALGTNPIAVVAPAACGEVFYLDMATAAASLGKIEMQIRKSKPIPPGWAQSMDGNVTTDSQMAYDTKCLMPLGGSEINSGFKGYGLAAMVEIFCGISSGSTYGHRVRGWGKTGPANLSHCFVAVDPNCFAPGFGLRLYDCLCTWRSLVPTDPCFPVMAPGDKEKYHAGNVDRCGYVNVVEHLIYSCAELAKKLKVKQMEAEIDNASKC